jgi:prepilin signal peptidase PulO-like enzyme (type II secretory pathway)
LLYFWFNGLSVNIENLYELSIVFILLALVFFDYLYFILPDKIIFSGLGLSLAYTLLYKTDFIFNASMTGLGLAGFFAIIYLVSGGKWMGFGDVKLALFTGFILGFPMGVFSMIAAVWAGALFGIVMMLIKKASLETALPFGSFIGVSAVLFIIFNVDFILSSI